MTEPTERMEYQAGLDTSHGGSCLTPSEIQERDMIEYLTFCSYRENRRLSPEVEPEQWEAVYGPKAKQLEERFQREAARSI